MSGETQLIPLGCWALISTTTHKGNPLCHLENCTLHLGIAPTRPYCMVVKRLVLSGNTIQVDPCICIWHCNRHTAQTKPHKD